MHEHLLGSTFRYRGKLVTVQQIVPAPFDEINKFIFFHFLLENDSASFSLSYYRVPFFDVLVVYRDALDGNNPGYLSLKQLQTIHQIVANDNDSES